METHYCNKSLELGDQVGYLIAEGTVLGTLFLVILWQVLVLLVAHD